MVVNSVVQMLSAFRLTSIVMDITIVQMKVMKPIVQQLHVPIINFYAHVVVQMAHPNV